MGDKRIAEEMKYMEKTSSIKKAVPKKENEYLHALKGLSCILIIFAHFPISGIKGSLLNAMAHLAVLVFFVVCGKYVSLPAKGVKGSEIGAFRKKNLCKIWNMVKMTMGIVGVYTLFSFVFLVIRGSYSFSEWLSMKYAGKEWVQQILFNAGKVIYDELFYVDHMWYMFAVIYVLVIICILIRYMNIRTSLLFMLPLVLQLLMTYFWNVPEYVDIFGIAVEGRVLTRNFFVIGMPFVGFGIFLQQIEKNEKYVAIFSQRRTKIALSCMTLLGIGWMIADCIRMGSRDLYLGTALAVMSVTALSLSVDGCRVRGLVYLGKHLSGNIYFWHPLIGVLLMITPLREMLGDLFTLLVVVVSVFVAFLLEMVRRNMEREDKRAIMLMAAAVAACFLFCVGFWQYGTRVKKDSLKDVEVLKSSENVLFFVKEICYNQKGDALIYAWSKNGNIHYPFHNWVLGDSDEEYKIAEIVLTDGEDVMYVLKTYPYEMGTEDVKTRWILDPKDGCVAYVKKEYCQRDDLSIAVVFSDREGNRYIVYQDKEYEKNL